MRTVAAPSTMDALDGFMKSQKPISRQGSRNTGMASGGGPPEDPLDNLVQKRQPEPAAPVKTEAAPITTKKYGCPAYGYSEDANKDFRPYMEDAHVVVEEFRGPGSGYFGLYDGHGGKQAVDFVVSRLHDAVIDQIEKDCGKDHNSGIKSESMDKAFLSIDELLKKSGSFRCGTTAVVCLVTVENGTRQLYTLNCGDSRAVLVDKTGQVTRLSYDDKSTDPQEVQRVLDGGGAVFRDRVAGALAVTRSLGDWALKDCGVIATPHFDKRVLDGTASFLILASDGLWDVMSDTEAANMAASHTEPQALSEALMKKALELGTRDNISVLVIKC